jgi:dTDP-4-dehydrorhamnose reductase
MYLVVGASGFLGSYVIKNVLSETKDTIIATCRDTSKVKDSDRVKWRACAVDNYEDVDRLLAEVKDEPHLKIVYLAAFHHPDKVQADPTFAWNINVTALSGFLNKIDFAESFFYSSTDGVYGESENGYRYKEEDRYNPVNIYGHQKCAAESITIHKGFNVVRFPFLISPSIVGKKHFYDVIADTIKGGTPMEMYEDSYRSSLSFNNAAYLLVKVMEMKGAGVDVPQALNICGDQDLSKYDVGLMVADQVGSDRSLIKPIKMGKVVGKFVTKRATSTLMDNTKLKKLLGLKKIDIFVKPE